MSTRPSSNAAKAAQVALGARLRDLRKDAGHTGRALAVLTGQHYTRVSKIENGIQPPTDDDIRAWCTACGVEAQVPDLIASLRAVESAYVEFRRQARAGMKRVLGAHTLATYRRTRVFRIYEHNAVPGLFQTADYCAAMLRRWIDFLGTEDDLDEAVAVRMERQRILYRGDKRFVVIIEEQVLRTWFGTVETQAGQLDRLLAVSTLPNVVVGIVPMMTQRAGPVPSTGFWIFDDRRVALETPTASIDVTQPGERRLYEEMFDTVKTSAIFGAGARKIVTRTLVEINEIMSGGVEM